MQKLKDHEVQAFVVFLVIALIMNEKFMKKKPAPTYPPYYGPFI